MPRIHVLPDALVNQIAAGEVVERPASVVKELVENALDAGATRVSVEVEGGGAARIAVLDDGCGMTPEDAALAFERHATSKIRSLLDLSRISTLGFRGEALPSIASVSRLTLSTSPDDSGLGTEVTAERGAPPRIAPARHPKGTRVVVEDLFGNVPARRKFLKSAEGELRAIVRALTAQALGYPDVAFTLRAGERTPLELPVTSSARARFAETLGSATRGDVLPVAFEMPGMKLAGAVTRPEVTFASRSNQWLFVNGRPVKDATVNHAARLAVEETLRSDRHAAFVLFLSLDPELCDVNVHPQKLEVRFRDPSAVHSLVHRGLAAALGGGKTAGSLGGFSLRPVEPFRGAPSGGDRVSETRGEWGGIREDGLASAALLAPPAVAPSRAAYADAPAVSPVGPLKLLGQYRDSFLVAESAEGIVLVDQHVAHERVRYERIRARLLDRTAPSQQLLIPVRFEATPEESALLASFEDLLLSSGFVVSELSGRTFVVSSTPPDCAAGAVEPFLRDFLARLGEIPEATRTPDGIRDALAASLACRGAITIHTRLSPEEATRLLLDLSACRDPFPCPHGRPILLRLEHGEILKRFGRSADRR